MVVELLALREDGGPALDIRRCTNPVCECQTYLHIWNGAAWAGLSRSDLDAILRHLVVIIEQRIAHEIGLRRGLHASHLFHPNAANRYLGELADELRRIAPLLDKNDREVNSGGPSS